MAAPPAAWETDEDCRRPHEGLVSMGLAKKEGA